jgi:RimJ/RimL family protein N-acetyltransferase
MNLRKMTVEDVERFGLEPAFAAALTAQIEADGSATARIGEAAGRPVFAAGVSIFWPGVGEMWIRILEPDILLGHAFEILDLGKRMLSEIVADLDLHRLQAIVRADDEKTLRFDRFMGFEEEGRMGAFYADRCDAVILRYKQILTTD